MEAVDLYVSEEGKEKKRIQNKKWREKNPDYDRKRYKNNKEYFRENRKKNKKRNVDWFKVYKKTLKCEKCNENHPACLEFHHVDGDLKENNVSDMVHAGYSLETIKIEISKCNVLCANCHRKHHFSC